MLKIKMTFAVIVLAVVAVVATQSPIIRGLFDRSPDTVYAEATWEMHEVPELTFTVNGQQHPLAVNPGDLTGYARSADYPKTDTLILHVKVSQVSETHIEFTCAIYDEHHNPVAPRHTSYEAPGEIVCIYPFSDPGKKK